MADSYKKHQDLKPGSVKLSSRVEDLPVSKDLKKLLIEKGYQVLKDVLTKRISELRNHDGLNYSQEIELFKIVEENGYLRWWRE